VAPKLSRAQASRDAGLSPDQTRDALRVARGPTEDFEAAMESDDAPSVTALAERGKARPIVNLNGRDPRNAGKPPR
jgi:hypothetical protein